MMLVGTTVPARDIRMCVSVILSFVCSSVCVEFVFFFFSFHSFYGFC